MENLYLILPNQNISSRLEKMIASFTEAFDAYFVVQDPKDTDDLQNKKLLWAIEVGETGFDISMLRFMSELRKIDPCAFSGSVGAVLIHSDTELGTKRFAQDIIFMANNMGCAFIGQPLVEETGEMKNFLTWQKTIDLPLTEICLNMCKKLAQRLKDYAHKRIENPQIKVIYSSPHKLSNTLTLWRMINAHLGDYDIEEIQIENGRISDCKGCSYTLCRHYAKKNTCFYGGFMTENVLPAIEKADSVIWLCPNYNDSFSANIAATINRLTVLCLMQCFHDKTMFGVIVSGNSGSDSVAKQLIGALNINKGFKLPPYAILSETANDPGAILKVRDIEKKAGEYAKNFIKELT